MTEPQVTPRQCVEAIQEISQGWPADDPRWTSLGVLMDYSIQFGQRDGAGLPDPR